MFNTLQEGLHPHSRACKAKASAPKRTCATASRWSRPRSLEADVSYDVVRGSWTGDGESGGTRVLLSLRPHEELIKIVYDELVQVLGPVDNTIQVRKDVAVIMMCGLQGSGKRPPAGSSPNS